VISRRTFLSACAALPAVAQQPAPSYPPVLEGSVVETYKTVADTKLNLWIYQPERSADKLAPAIVFFFGGGWRSGTPKQFEHHCKHFASRGAVAITADYRVSSRHQSTIADSVRDAKSAVRWLRGNAKRLGIDPERIAAGGGSAGGHLAAARALLPGFEEAGEDSKVSARPNLLVLFNPVLLLAPAPEIAFELKNWDTFRQRLGAEPVSISPYHHVTKSAPPAIIFHGTGDTTVPYATAAAFTSKMKQAGVRCELDGFEGKPHGFFNYGRDGNENYRLTLKRADDFLVSLGYLSKVAARETL
jgi:acetyl esterase